MRVMARRQHSALRKRARVPALLLALVCALLLTACGFHLRGSPAAGTGGPASVSLIDQSRQSASTWLGDGPGELARIARDTLEDGGISIEETAPIQLELVGEFIEKRVASVDASAKAAEYQLDYTLVWRARGSDGAVLVNDTRLTLDRSYRHKANAIMGSAEEEALLQRDLRRDAAMQILRQLKQLPVNKVNTSAAPVAAGPAQPSSVVSP